MDSIIMEIGINDIESAVEKTFISKDTRISDPLESTGEGVLNIGEILDTLRSINQKVWSHLVWTEIPDLLCIMFIPTEVGDKHFSPDLVLHHWGDISVDDHLSKFVWEGSGSDPKSVMLVWGL